MTPDSLAAKLTSLRASTSTSYKSEVLTPFPLEAFLCIYNKSGTECYINYMKGAKELIDYLSPIEIPEISYDLLPKGQPALFHYYEVQKLAGLLDPTGKYASRDNQETGFYYLEGVILYLTAKIILGDIR